MEQCVPDVVNRPGGSTRWKVVHRSLGALYAVLNRALGGDAHLTRCTGRAVLVGGTDGRPTDLENNAVPIPSSLVV
ncbi:hypothetical protein NDU88_001389 [Pleurodeles waltl]|uniref:Uncharacterized protein n=1 Tax=Pleurodeles waltl TaxID=8319 RepID=A0AAV7LXI0_PLEWA|nr:hypothetical protein NDU88_001389 [Pleurodeles waltl]